jgi:hypothetical protein
MVELSQIANGEMMTLGVMGFVAHHFKILSNLQDSQCIKSNPWCYVRHRPVKFILSLIFTYIAFRLIVIAGPTKAPGWNDFYVGYIFLATFLSSTIIDRTGSIVAKRWPQLINTMIDKIESIIK